MRVTSADEALFADAAQQQADAVAKEAERQAATRRRELWESSLHESGHVTSRAILLKCLSSAQVWPGGGATFGAVAPEAECYGTVLGAGDAAGALSWGLTAPPATDDITVETTEIIEADRVAEEIADQADAPSDAKLLAIWCTHRGPAIPPTWTRNYETAHASARDFVRKYVGIIVRIAEYLFAFRELSEADLLGMLPAGLRKNLRFPNLDDTTAGDPGQDAGSDRHGEAT